MSISEIESILQSLRTRHPDLDAKMLEVLLSAGGWDSSIIRDTLLLFKTGKTNTVTAPVERSSATNGAVPKPLEVVSKKQEEDRESELPQNNEVILPKVEILIPPLPTDDLVYITNDGEEEGRLVTEDTTPKEMKREDGPKQIIAVHPEVVKTPKEVVVAQAEVISSGGTSAPQVSVESLVEPVLITERKQEIEIPSNLPIKPFESTPHVWPFSKYKDVFYGEVMPPVTKEEKYLRHTPAIEHFSVEKEPLTRKDEGLVFLAGSMLLVIILLLGYMYSNGRL